MPRPEKPIDFTVPDVGRLAEYLREIKHASGKTYAELAEGSHESESSFKRAARGGRLPTVDVLVAFTAAADGDLGHALMLYERAEDSAAAAKVDAKRSTVRPKPEFVYTRAELGNALRDAYKAAGCPPIREMAKRGGLTLPRSTANRIIKALNVPRNVRTYLAFLTASEVEGDRLIPWFEAWVRVYGFQDDGMVGFILGLDHPEPSESAYAQWTRGLGRFVRKSISSPELEVLIEVANRQAAAGIDEVRMAA